MIPEDWLEYVVAVEKDLKRPPFPIKKHKPKVTRMQSGRMKIIAGQTPNPIRATYTPENEYNATPIIAEPEKHTWAGTSGHEVGPNDQYNPAEGYRGGKATVEPTKSNKTHAPGRRAYGGGTNKGTTENIDKLTEQFLKGLK
jgi:hypothetical protein